MDGWNMTGWGWAWMGLFPVLLIIAVVLVVRLVMREVGSGQIREEHSASEVLRHRFAAGEIDEDEFNRRLASLERTSTRRQP
jgi:putative membrane protein